MGVKKAMNFPFLKDTMISSYIFLNSLLSVEGCEHRNFSSFLACLELFVVGFLAVLAFNSVQISRSAWTLINGHWDESSSLFVTLWCYLFSWWVKSHSNGFLQVFKQKKWHRAQSSDTVDLHPSKRGHPDYSTEGLVLWVGKSALL